MNGRIGSQCSVDINKRNAHITIVITSIHLKIESKFYYFIWVCHHYSSSIILLQTPQEHPLDSCPYERVGRYAPPASTKFILVNWTLYTGLSFVGNTLI